MRNSGWYHLSVSRNASPEPEGLPLSPLEVEQKKDKEERDKARRKRRGKNRWFLPALVSLLILALAVALWQVTIAGLEARQHRNTWRWLDPLFEKGPVYVGVEVFGYEEDSLIAFSPAVEDYVNLGELAPELMATVNTGKTRLVYVLKSPGPLWRSLSYLASENKGAVLKVLDGPGRRIRVVSHGFPGELMSGLYGMTNIWGGSDDKVYLTLVEMPETYSIEETLAHLMPWWFEFKETPSITHVYYTVSGEGRSKFTRFPLLSNLRGVAFTPEGTWYVSASGTTIRHKIGRMDEERHVEEHTLPFKPLGLHAIYDGELLMVLEHGRQLRSRSGFWLFSEDGKSLKSRLELPLLIRRARVDSLNGLIFFVLAKGRIPGTEVEAGDKPRLKYRLVSIPIADIYSDKSLSMDDLTPIAEFHRGSSQDYFDLDVRNRKAIFSDMGRLYEVGYDGSGRKELWMPAGMSLNWVQVLYGD